MKQDILQHAEQCNGSGDCRKTHLSGGTMCPSYMATRNEKDTTRARANILREFLTHSDKQNRYDHKEIYDVMSLCLSCKACKSECPSNVDMAKLKAEFLQHYYDQNGVPFRSKLIGNFSKQMQWASKFSLIYNLIFGNTFLRKIANRVVGFHPDRSIPLMSSSTLTAWYKKQVSEQTTYKRKVYFFCDEFTNYYDVEIGKIAIQLLEKMGYKVLIPKHVESGRSFLSKGLVKQAAEIINHNIDLLSSVVNDDIPLIGIEPSAILSFRDEYIDLATPLNKEKALKLSKQTFTIEEFVANEYEKGNIAEYLFIKDEKTIAVHGHCYQKVLSSQHFSNTMLSIPKNYQVHFIPSGCCGMAGSFGYESEHFEVSQQVGELVLFPAVRKFSSDTIVAASGTSCRHQIKDGTHRIALHPVEILWNALEK
jgi:Fe-S oxidoreductase